VEALVVIVSHGVDWNWIGHCGRINHGGIATDFRLGVPKIGRRKIVAIVDVVQLSRRRLFLEFFLRI
jgi:hypothetical protein